MKKLLVCLSVVMGVIFTSCTSSDENYPDYEANKAVGYVNVGQPVIVQQLTEVNDSIRETVGGQESRGWFGKALKSLADALGAYAGGKMGAAVGGAIGTLVGNPSGGREVGEKIGSEIIGTLASHATKLKCGGIMVFPDMDKMKLAYCTVSESYPDMAGDDDSDVAHIGMLDLPAGMKPIEDIGRMHNDMLD